MSTQRQPIRSQLRSSSGTKPAARPGAGGSSTWQSLTRRLRIARTEQLTLITMVASADFEQEAAHISLSGDSVRRNFTLGQEQGHLTSYLRTPVTGNSAWHIPELFVPEVFADTRPHQVIVTYDHCAIPSIAVGLATHAGQSAIPSLLAAAATTFSCRAAPRVLAYRGGC